MKIENKWVLLSLFGLIFLLIISILILSCVPPVSRDALTHHLFVPKLYLKHGGIYEIPDFTSSYYPMNLDILYMIPLYFSNDIIPKLIHFSFALLTGWVIYGYLLKRTNTEYALLGPLFFLSIPIIFKLSITAYVDLGLIFFTTTSLFLVLKWLEESKTKWLIVSGVMCGLALGTKYNGIISFLLLSLFIPIAYLKYPGGYAKSQKKALAYAGLFLLVSSIVFFPWMIRNYMWKKNPVFPLFNNFFSPPTPRIKTVHMDEAAPESNTPLKPFALRKLVYKESGWEIITIPIRIFFQGKDDDPKYFDGKLNPFLLLFPLFLLIGFNNQPPSLQFELKYLFYFCILFIFFVFFQQDMRIRYVGPAIAPLVILSIMGLSNLSKTLLKDSSHAYRKKFFIVFIGFITLFLLYNLFYIAKQFRVVDPFSYLTGKLDRENYIERFRPEYAVIRYANRTLSTNDKVMALFLGNRGYYMDFDVNFDNGWFYSASFNPPSPDNILLELQKRGISHLILRFDLFNDWMNMSLDTNRKTTFAAFFQYHTKLLYSKAGYRLYMVLP